MSKFLEKLKNHFLPHEGNNHNPHFLRHKSITFFLLIVIILELSLLVQIFVVFNKTNFLAAVLPGVLTSITNQQRVDNNLGQLKESELLKKAAQLKANDMATKGYFAHVSPEGKTPWYWFDQVSYRYKLAGENLAVNFFESEDVARAWMASPTHKANIVKAEYTEIGIAVANGIYQGKNAVFVVQLFAKPLEPINILKPINTKEITLNKIIKPIAVKKVETPKVQVLGEELNTNKVISVEEKNIKTEELEKTSNGNQEKVMKNYSIISSIKNKINELLLSPSITINKLLYLILGLILFGLLIFLIKTEIMHPAVLLRSFFLITVIILLLFVNIRMFDKNANKEAYKTSFTSIAL